MDKLNQFYKQAIQIDRDPHLFQDQKDKKLAGLMTEMEIMYEIPMLRSIEWEKKHPEIISIYREISDMRKL